MKAELTLADLGKWLASHKFKFINYVSEIQHNNESSLVEYDLTFKKAWLEEYDGEEYASLYLKNKNNRMTLYGVRNATLENNPDESLMLTVSIRGDSAETETEYLFIARYSD